MRLKMKKDDFNNLLTSFAEMASMRGAVSSNTYRSILNAARQNGDANNLKLPSAFDKFQTKNSSKITKQIPTQNTIFNNYITEETNNNNQLSQKLQQFIKNNSELINNNEWVKLLRKDDLPYVDYPQLLEIIKFVSGLNDDELKEIRLQAVAEDIYEDIQYYLSQPKKFRLLDDPSEGWSRLSWIMMGVNGQDLNYNDIVNYLIKNKNKYNFKMREIDSFYNYQSPGSEIDYDLAGVFDEKAFDKYYSEEE